VTATLAADDNYSSATSTAYAFSIVKGDSTISVTGLTSFTYNGSAQGPDTSTKTGSTGAVSYSYSGSGYGPSATKPTAVGSYTVTATVAADDNYNSASSTAYTFSIVPVGETFASWSGNAATNSANVGKYLIGGATNVNDASARPVMTANSSNLVLSAIVRTNDTNGRVVGQWVTNVSGFAGLASGSNEVTGTPAAVQGTVPGGCQRQEFTIGRTNGTNRLFLRLKATLNP